MHWTSIVGTLTVILIIVFWIKYASRPVLYLVYSKTCSECEKFVHSVMPGLQMSISFKMVDVADTRKLERLKINPADGSGQVSVPNLFRENVFNDMMRYTGNMDDKDSILQFASLKT